MPVPVIAPTGSKVSLHTIFFQSFGYFDSWVL